MADVNVNIRGRDDGLSATLDSLRDKANQLGRDIGNLDNIDSLTKTEKRLEIERVTREVAEEQKRKIREEFSSIREENLRDFSQTQQDYQSGRITKKQFDIEQQRFNESNTQLNNDEAHELTAIEKEANHHLKLILRQLLIQERLDRERRQRDGNEFPEGSIGHLLSQNTQLRNQQRGSTDQSEIDLLQEQIESNNARINAMRNNSSGDDDGGGNGGNYNRFTSGMQQGAMSAARGDLSGTVMGGLQMAGGIGKLATGLTIAGIIAMVIKEFIGHGEKIQEAIGSTAAMRGGSGGTAGVFNQQLQSKIATTDILGNLGLSGDEFAGIVNQKAAASRMAGNNVTGRALDDFAFQKGFGADVGMFSEFERFTKGQETATDIGLDVLNVLTSIEKSSLKENDLSVLAEKLQAQQSILSLQRSKRDVVDNDSALRVLAAFENIGLSGKGEKAGDFLSQTIQGLGEGGSDNAMMFKYEAAKRARPDLANDPAALRRFVKFNSDDPKYLAESMKFFGQSAGGSEMAMDDMIYTLFNPQSEMDMDIYKKAMRGDAGFSGALNGNIDKSRKGTLNKDAMYADAQTSVGAVTTAMSDFSNSMQKFSINMENFFKNPLKTSIINWPSWLSDSDNSTRKGK